ncbi:2-oxo-4-hydroxy-4-carboxy-5-ureidoimidazoline decarboxylase-like isoform X1 [Apostichopus japonicus]|uniref:2-oxo-4-hydroxy-4-carboxy-5-ureidoimidazoline decarboxylase-like isoform X1 n=2 Tax=Stichopus japonicus TaxID=307972 RepID=UPI003AB3CE43
MTVISQFRPGDTSFAYSWGIVAMAKVKSLEDINNLGYKEFGDYLANVVAKTPMIPLAAWSDRPFCSVRDLHATLCKFLDNLPFQGKEGLLRCYPDLPSRLAIASNSFRDINEPSRRAGLLTLSSDDLELITDLNDKYTRKFGFPFVICVNESKRHAIVQGLQLRLKHSRQEEVLMGIANVKLCSHTEMSARDAV